MHCIQLAMHVDMVYNSPICELLNFSSHLLFFLDASLAYNILFHIQKVDRFKLLTMFVPEHDKAMLNTIFETLTSASGPAFSQKDVENLKDSYGT
jgi:hypothetical protein